ncbi:MAG: AIR carboxylase family protein, partial [Bacteroidales bacterium]
PVATMAVDGAMNAAIFALQILAVGDPSLMKKMVDFKTSLAGKIAKANAELAEVKFAHKTN